MPPKKKSKAKKKSTSKTTRWELMETKEEPTYYDYENLINEIQIITGFPKNIIYQILFYAHNIQSDKFKGELKEEYNYWTPKGYISGLYYDDPSEYIESLIYDMFDNNYIPVINKKKEVFRIIRYFFENKKKIQETSTPDRYNQIVNDINILIEKYLPRDVDDFYKRVK